MMNLKWILLNISNGMKSMLFKLESLTENLHPLKKMETSLMRTVIEGMSHQRVNLVKVNQKANTEKVNEKVNENKNKKVSQYTVNQQRVNQQRVNQISLKAIYLRM